MVHILRLYRECIYARLLDYIVEKLNIRITGARFPDESRLAMLKNTKTRGNFRAIIFRRERKLMPRGLGRERRRASRKVGNLVNPQRPGP